MSAATPAAAATSIEELIGRYQDRRLPRQGLLRMLTAAGASAAVAATLANAADSAAPSLAPFVSPSSHRQAAAVAVHPTQAHQQHVAAQVAGTTAPTPQARATAVARMLDDYSPNAVVNDPMFGGPLVGKAAIAVHKTAEMAAISDVSLNVLASEMVGDQLVASWEMTGLHDGPYYTYPATGRRIALSGTTVQTRGKDGKIATETLYYDAAHMHRQLSGG